MSIVIAQMPGMLDLYYLLVEVTFGSYWVTFFGLIILFWLIAAAGNFSKLLTVIMLGMFAMVFFIGTFDAIFGSIMFIAALGYAVFAIIGLIDRWRG